jgi:hypothetical protein
MSTAIEWDDGEKLKIDVIQTFDSIEIFPPVHDT